MADSDELPSSGRESSHPVKRARSEPPSTNSARVELIIVEEPASPPEHLSKLPFVLDSRVLTCKDTTGQVCSKPPNASHCVVIGIAGDVPELEPGATAGFSTSKFDRQARICDTLKLTPSEIIVPLLHGHFPDNLIVHVTSENTKQLIWFACPDTSPKGVIPIDVTNWYVVPGVAIRDCRCVNEQEYFRNARDALGSLRELIEANSHTWPEQEYIRAQGFMQKVFRSIQA